MLNSATLTRILVEVTNGAPPARPDTPEMAEKRAQYAAEVAAIRAKGLVVDVPQEIP